MVDPNAPPLTGWDFPASDMASVHVGDPEEDFLSFVNLFEIHPETVCDFGDIILNVDDGFPSLASNPGFFLHSSYSEQGVQGTLQQSLCCGSGHAC